MSEGHGVIEVHGLAFRLGAVGVDQHDFGSQSAQEQGIGKSRAHIADAHYGHTDGMCTVLAVSVLIEHLA